MENDNKKKEQCTIQNVSNSVDFFKDVKEFLESQLPKDFGDNMKAFVESKDYKQNDVRLFKSMLQEAVGFEATMILLKHYC
jgi:hypothetical protein